MSTETRARQLLRVAMATYGRGEHDIAKDIFALAMEDKSAKTLLGPTRPGRTALLRAVRAALARKQYAQAIRHLKAVQAMDEMEGLDEMDIELEDELDMDSEDESEEESEEAALSPGDAIDVVPVPELAPAQVASIVALTRQIRAGGHEDLAAKITKALGL